MRVFCLGEGNGTSVTRKTGDCLLVHKAQCSTGEDCTSLPHCHQGGHEICLANEGRRTAEPLSQCVFSVTAHEPQELKLGAGDTAISHSAWWGTP